jgi:hypothetical protein
MQPDEFRDRPHASHPYGQQMAGRREGHHPANTAIRSMT